MIFAKAKRIDFSSNVFVNLRTNSFIFPLFNIEAKKKRKKKSCVYCNMPPKKIGWVGRFFFNSNVYV